MSNSLPRSTPEAQGMASASILHFLTELKKRALELHSLMILRHGHVVAEGWWSPYAADRPHMLFSLSKSFTSTAIGLAVHEKRLSLDDLVLSYFPAEAPEQPSEFQQAMRVRDLLTMSTGHAEDTTNKLRQDADGNWARAFLAEPVEHLPGTHFCYNSGATYMLAAILQKVTGEHLLDYLRPRLLAPLGIYDATWENCPRGIATGGWGLKIRTEDIARFGQLYLQQGGGRGEQGVPADWVAAATAFQVANDQGKSDQESAASDWMQGYGYQFWRCRHGAYRGDGAFGQFCVVLPAQDAVVAITSGVDQMQAVLDCLWEHVLPTFHAEPLANDANSHALLTTALAELTLEPPVGITSSSLERQIAGVQYTEQQEWGQAAVSFAFDEEGCTVTLVDEIGEYNLRAGRNRWYESVVRFAPLGDSKVAASGIWQDEQTYEMTCRLIETPFYQTLVCRFSDDQVTVERRVNLSFGAKELPTLHARKVSSLE